MADTTLRLPENRNRQPIDPAQVSLLQRLRSLSNVGGMSQRGLDITTGADDYAPTEGELLQQQLSPIEQGGGTYSTPGGNTGSISRDLLRESGVQQFKRKLKALNEQYVVPKQFEGEYGMATQRIKNAGDIQTEQVKGQNAATTAAVPRTVNQNINTNAGGAANAAGNDYAVGLAKRAMGQIDYILPKVNSMSSGIGGRLMGLYPGGSQSRELSTELKSLTANIGFGELQAMRQASKTGGALGQVSDIENQLLSMSRGGLDQYNSPEVVRQQLDRIKQSFARWMQEIGAQGGSFDPSNGLGIQTDTGGSESDPYGLFGGQ